jgi:hypothetical protein
MLGESPLSERVRCWLRLVTSTSIDAATNLARPAKRDEQGQPRVEEPLWFRIGQFRLPKLPAIKLVQRIVLINSFAFTLLIARSDENWPCSLFDQWIATYPASFPEAKLILPGATSAVLAAGSDHAAASLLFSVANYPSRFSNTPSPYVEGVLKGNIQRVMLQIPKELIENGSIDPIAEILHDMVSTKEKAAASKQRVAVATDGFDDDPRALWQIPQARQFFRRLFRACPFVMFLSHPEGDLLKLFAACWLYDDDVTEAIQRERMAEFLNRAFSGLNGLNHSIALSEEQNREICQAAAKTLFAEMQPGTIPTA